MKGTISSGPGTLRIRSWGNQVRGSRAVGGAAAEQGGNADLEAPGPVKKGSGGRLSACVRA